AVLARQARFGKPQDQGRFVDRGDLVDSSPPGLPQHRAVFRQQGAVADGPPSHLRGLGGAPRLSRKDHGEAEAVSVAIRPAGPGDASDVFRLVRELAVYEKLLDQMVATEEAIAAALFGPHPRVFCDLAIRDERAVGFAIWFYTYST